MGRELTFFQSHWAITSPTPCEPLKSVSRTVNGKPSSFARCCGVTVLGSLFVEFPLLLGGCAFGGLISAAGLPSSVLDNKS